MRTHARRAVALLCVMCLPMIAAAQSYDGYYNFLGDAPSEASPSYTQDDVQGIAHSDDHWFITKSNPPTLYKIHVSQNLNSPSAAATTTPSQSGLPDPDYTTFKGMDSYREPTTGRWIVVVGVEGSADGVAFYDENLVLLGAAALTGQSAAGWCAIDAEGRLFSGLNNQAELRRYAVNWSTLANGGNPVVTFEQTVALRDASGNSLSLNHFQGGAFTPEGDKIYITTGYIDEGTSLHGIHAFDVTRSDSVFYRVRKSGQSGLFHYQFAPEFLTSEEPEDLTFWDLTDGRAPEIDGELHVLLLDNDAFGDDVYIKHYTRGIYVDSAHGGGSNGDPDTPEKTVAAGVARALEDMELRITPGLYPEVLVVDKRVRLTARPTTGSVVIGQ